MNSSVVKEYRSFFVCLFVLHVCLFGTEGVGDLRNAFYSGKVNTKSEEKKKCSKWVKNQ